MKSAFMLMQDTDWNHAQFAQILIEFIDEHGLSIELEEYVRNEAEKEADEKAKQEAQTGEHDRTIK